MAARLLASLLGLRVCKVTLNSEFCEPYGLREHRICSLSALVFLQAGYWMHHKHPSISILQNSQTLWFNQWAAQFGSFRHDSWEQLPPLDPPSGCGRNAASGAYLSIPSCSALLCTGDLPAKGCQGKVSCCADIPRWGTQCLRCLGFSCPCGGSEMRLFSQARCSQLYLGATQSYHLWKTCCFWHSWWRFWSLLYILAWKN